MADDLLHFTERLMILRGIAATFDAEQVRNAALAEVYAASDDGDAVAAHRAAADKAVARSKRAHELLDDEVAVADAAGYDVAFPVGGGVTATPRPATDGEGSDSSAAGVAGPDA